MLAVSEVGRVVSTSANKAAVRLHNCKTKAWWFTACLILVVFSVVSCGANSTLNLPLVDEGNDNKSRLGFQVDDVEFAASNLDESSTEQIVSAAEELLSAARVAINSSTLAVADKDELLAKLTAAEVLITQQRDRLTRMSVDAGVHEITRTLVSDAIVEVNGQFATNAWYGTPQFDLPRSDQDGIQIVLPDKGQKVVPLLSLSDSLRFRLEPSWIFDLNAQQRLNYASRLLWVIANQAYTQWTRHLDYEPVLPRIQIGALGFADCPIGSIACATCQT